MSRSLARFLRRSPEERRLFVHAFMLHAVISWACALLPFGRLIRLLAWAYPSSTRPGAPIDRVIWAVRAAAAVSRRSTCLTEALTAQSLMRRHGSRTSLQIGVAHGAAGLDAHAWLQDRQSSGSRLVLGASTKPFVTIWAGE